MLLALNGGLATLVNCTFIDNIIEPSTSGASPVTALARLSHGDEVVRDTEVWLQGCTFTSSTPPSEPLLLVEVRNEEEFKAVIYSDEPAQTVCTLTGSWEWEEDIPDCVVGAPEALGVPGDQFLINSSGWFTQTQMVRCQYLFQLKIHSQAMPVYPSGLELLNAPIAAAWRGCETPDG